MPVHEEARKEKSKSSKFNRALRIPSQQLWKRTEETRAAEEGEQRSQGEQ